ncbi:MAG: FIST N-terminal domain-containing protein [Sandaracinaceae bacterium]
MSKLLAGVGISIVDETPAAVADAVGAARDALSGRAPGLAIVTATVDHDAAEVHAALRSQLPSTPIHGVTTSLGVLGANGVSMGRRGALGVLLLAGEGLHFAVGSAPVGADAVAAGRAAAKALGERRPSVVLFNPSPGAEEDLLRGVAEVLPGVPVFGGSAADHAIAGDWKVFTNEGVLGTGVSLAAVAGDVAVGAHFLAPYRATGREAVVTRAHGRTIAEIDGAPAVQKLHEWIGGSIDDQVAQGGNVLAQTALRPIAIRHAAERSGDFYLTVHPAHVHARVGAVDVFARMAPGTRICAMEGTPEDLVGSIDTLIDRARADGGLEAVRAGVLIYCAGCAGSVGARLDGALREAWGRAMAGVPLLGMCTFGEQGTVPGVGPVHANLSMGLVLLGER